MSVIDYLAYRVFCALSVHARARQIRLHRGEAAYPPVTAVSPDHFEASS